MEFDLDRMVANILIGKTVTRTLQDVENNLKEIEPEQREKVMNFLAEKYYEDANNQKGGFKHPFDNLSLLEKYGFKVDISKIDPDKVKERVANRMQREPNQDAFDILKFMRDHDARVDLPEIVERGYELLESRRSILGPKMLAGAYENGQHIDYDRVANIAFKLMDEGNEKGYHKYVLKGLRMLNGMVKNTDYELPDIYREKIKEKLGFGEVFVCSKENMKFIHTESVAILKELGFSVDVTSYQEVVLEKAKDAKEKQSNFWKSWFDAYLGMAGDARPDDDFLHALISITGSTYQKMHKKAEGMLDYLSLLQYAQKYGYSVDEQELLRMEEECYTADHTLEYDVLDKLHDDFGVDTTQKLAEWGHEQLMKGEYRSGMPALTKVHAWGGDPQLDKVKSTAYRLLEDRENWSKGMKILNLAKSEIGLEVDPVIERHFNLS